MRAEYLILNSVFLLALFGLDWFVLQSKVVARKETWVAVLVLVGLTAIFYNIVLKFDVVTYDQSRILGLKIGLIPVEDFCYAIAAPILVSSLMRFYEKTTHHF